MEHSHDKRIVWQGEYLDVAIRDGWEFVERKNLVGLVSIVAVTDDGKLVLVEQYRPPLDARVIELPAGLVGDVAGRAPEPFEIAARRELLEETGYEAGRMEFLVRGTASAGICDEQVDFYLATELRKTGPGGGDDTETIVVHEAPIIGLADWLEKRQADGVLVDLKIFTGLCFWQQKVLT